METAASASGDGLAALAATPAARQEPTLAGGRDPAPRSGHHLVAQALAGLGVTHVFGVPGEPVYDTFGACAAAGLRPIGTRGQQAAAMMAAAQNYWAGRQVAVTVVSAGVAAANAVTGALVARDNGWPLLIVAGVPRNTDGQAPFMGLDVLGLYRPVTKSALRADTAGAIATALYEAYALAERGRPGPVLVALPADALDGESVPEPAAVVAALAIPPAPRLIRELAETLLGARRPLLVVGEGVRWDASFADLLQLVERLSLPFITTPFARGFLPDSHALCCNTIAWTMQREADVVLVLGSRLDWTIRYGVQITSSATLIHVDVDAAALAGGRARRLAVQAQPAVFLRALCAHLQAEGAAAHRGVELYWLDTLEPRRTAAELTMAGAVGARESPISPERLARAEGGPSGGCHHRPRRQRHHGGVPAPYPRRAPRESPHPRNERVHGNGDSLCDRSQAALSRPSGGRRVRRFCVRSGRARDGNGGATRNTDRRGGRQ